MKKLAILAALLVVAITNINAQESTPTELVSNHSIGINLLGVEYSYEQPLGSSLFAMNYSVGAGSNLIITNGTTYYSLVPYITLEPRCFYNIKKRNQKGKNTLSNSANYLAFKTRLLLPSMYANDSAMQSNTELHIAPIWGIKRVYGKHFLLDAYIGGGVGFGRQEISGLTATPMFLAGLKLGYLF